MPPFTPENLKSKWHEFLYPENNILFAPGEEEMFTWFLSQFTAYRTALIEEIRKKKIELDNCSRVDGRVQEECWKAYQRGSDFNVGLQTALDIINQNHE